MTRREHDFYPTPTSITIDLVNWLDDAFWTPLVSGKTPPVFFEPCVGRGDIIDVFKQRFYAEDQMVVLTNDIQPMLYPGQYIADATRADIWEHVQSVDVTITNPPFNLALPIIEHALHYSDVAVFALLRLSWLEPTKARRRLLDICPPDLIRVYGCPRPSFTGKGTDSVTTAWFAWFQDKAFDETDIGDIPSITVASDWQK